MSKEHHMISVSITRHLVDLPPGSKPNTTFCAYSRTLDGKSKAACSIGYPGEGEAVTRACLIVRCERSQRVGFADCKYSREVEIYGACVDDLEALRAIEAECQGKLLGPLTEDWRITDSVILNFLGECIYGSARAIDEIAGDNQ